MTSKNQLETGSTLSRAFPVGAVYLGLMVGGGMAAGSYAISYFAPYGGWTLVFLLLYIVGVASATAKGLNFSRVMGYHNYYDFDCGLWGNTPKVRKYMGPLFDVYAFISSVIGEASCIALGGAMFNVLFGLPVLVGSLIFIFIFTILMTYGDELLRIVNTGMTFILIITLAVLLFGVIYLDGNSIVSRLTNFGIYKEWNSNLGAGFKGIIMYTFMGMGAPATLSNVNQKLTSKKDCDLAGIFSGVFVASAFLVTTMIVLPYAPEVFGFEVPILQVVNTKLVSISKIFLIFYWIVMFFALISSGPTLTYNLANRVEPLFMKNSEMKKPTKLFILGILVNLIALVISSAGLTAIVGKGYQYLGYIAAPLIVLPIFLFTNKWMREKEGENGQSK